MYIISDSSFTLSLDLFKTTIIVIFGAMNNIFHIILFLSCILKGKKKVVFI